MIECQWCCKGHSGGCSCFWVRRGWAGAKPVLLHLPQEVALEATRCSQWTDAGRGSMWEGGGTQVYGRGHQGQRRMGTRLARVGCRCGAVSGAAWQALCSVPRLGWLKVAHEARSQVPAAVVSIAPALSAVAPRARDTPRRTSDLGCVTMLLLVAGSAWLLTPTAHCLSLASREVRCVGGGREKL